MELVTRVFLAMRSLCLIVNPNFGVLDLLSLGPAQMMGVCRGMQIRDSISSSIALDCTGRGGLQSAFRMLQSSLSNVGWTSPGRLSAMSMVVTATWSSPRRSGGGAVAGDTDSRSAEEPSHRAERARWDGSAALWSADCLRPLGCAMGGPLGLVGQPASSADALCFAQSLGPTPPPEMGVLAMVLAGGEVGRSANLAI